VCFSRGAEIEGEEERNERRERERERGNFSASLFFLFRLREASSERDFFFCIPLLALLGHQRPQHEKKKKREREFLSHALLVKNERALRFRGVPDLRLDD